jgi:hypothetical protein
MIFVRMAIEGQMGVGSNYKSVDLWCEVIYSSSPLIRPPLLLGQVSDALEKIKYW